MKYMIIYNMMQVSKDSEKLFNPGIIIRKNVSFGKSDCAAFQLRQDIQEGDPVSVILYEGDELKQIRTMYYNESDETIYSRFLAEKNERDLLVLIERYKESLTLFLNSFVNNPEDAEELMMDAFAEAAAGPTLFSARSSFKTWLFSIGKKLALMHIRRTRRFVSAAGGFRNDKGSLQEDRPEKEQPDEKTAVPELEILKSEQNRLLYEAMAGLNKEYCRILTLLYFEGMSREEAGQVMGKSRRQIYHLAERSRSALKKQLKEMGFEYEEI